MMDDSSQNFNTYILLSLNLYSKIKQGNEYARKIFADYRYLCLRHTQASNNFK